MRGFLYAIFCGLVLGGFIHVVSVLGLPRFAEQTAFVRVAAFGPDLKFNPMPRPGRDDRATLPLTDPAFAQFVCRFSLEDGPVRVRATPPDAFWSAAVFDPAGVNSYNLNDRAIGQKPLDLLVADAEQIALIRENPPADFNDIIIVDWRSSEGFVIVRIFAPTAADEADAAATMSQATCARQALG